MNRILGASLIESGLALAACTSLPPAASTAPPAGEVQGRAYVHTPESAAGVVSRARVALPATAGHAAWLGPWSGLPAGVNGRWPVVVFLHGSSGLGLPAIADWQRWLAAQGVASVAPDSFALPDRLTYKSPVDKAVYERIHALRASEIDLALTAVRAAPWVDPARIVLAGTSEGAVAVARYRGAGLAGRIIYAWSCEDNYMVQRHDTGVGATEPVLNVISTTDPFFSRQNAYLGRTDPAGHCGPALATHKAATIVLIPGAPHTLLNLPAARHATRAFLQDVARPDPH